jgi:hypothetical protein
MTPFPEWQAGGAHMNASTQELADLVKDEWWYRPGATQDAGRSQVFVSLYSDNKEIVIDSGINRIRDAIQKGAATTPVVFIYNGPDQRPVSRYGAKPRLQDVANDYFSSGNELTPVPLWEGGDHHLMTPIEDLKTIFNPPAKKDIPAERYQALTKELSGGIKKPFLLTLLGTGCGCAYIDDPARLTAASDLGIKEAPVVLFYHGLDRLPCGAPANCQDRVCDAIVAAGGSSSACSPGGQVPGQFSGRQPTSTVPFVPPPPPPPPSPN